MSHLNRFSTSLSTIIKPLSIASGFGNLTMSHQPVSGCLNATGEKLLPLKGSIGGNSHRSWYIQSFANKISVQMTIQRHNSNSSYIYTIRIEQQYHCQLSNIFGEFIVQCPRWKLEIYVTTLDTEDEIFILICFKNLFQDRDFR